AGIRTASVWTVGTATLATPIGQPCLGNYIFAGLQTRNWSMLLIGVLASAALALVLDAILAASERAVSRRPRGKLRAPAMGFAMLVAVVRGGLPRVPGWTGQSQASAPATSAAVASGGGRVGSVRIGAKTFTEQYILAEVLRQRLAGRGIGATVIE